MTDRMEQTMDDTALDEALALLAADVRENSPRPGPDLMARVLADAAATVPRLIVRLMRRSTSNNWVRSTP